MSEDLLKTIRDLIATGKGDIKRLRGIMSTIKQGNPVYLSDYRYIQSLTSEESAHQQVEDKGDNLVNEKPKRVKSCLLYTSPSPRDLSTSRMPSSA